MKRNETMKARKIITAYLLFGVMIMALFMILALWPNIDPANSLKFNKISQEFRILIFVICGGAFGSSVQGISNLFFGVLGKVKKEAISVYILRVFLGIPPALVVYFIIRTVILTPQASLGSLNATGILSISMTVGIFSFQLFERLSIIVRAIDGKQTELENKIERISSTLGIELLDNYKGYLFYWVENEEKQAPGGLEKRTYFLEPHKKYTLIVCFSPEPFGLPGFHNKEDIEITGGNQKDFVRFSVTAHFDFMTMGTREKFVEFSVSQQSDKLYFDFELIEQDTKPDIWIEIFQKNRLISVVVPDIQLTNSKK